MFDGLTGAQFSIFTEGLPTDKIVDGNYAGNFIDDITTIRSVSGVLQRTTRDNASVMAQPAVAFGASATDFTLTGDYDGDGLDDYSIWRPSATPGASKFSVRPSAKLATPIDIPMGSDSDYPVGNARTH